MDEIELLDALDRVAARAVAALDGGLVDSPPPPLERPAGPRRRPLVPLLVAAALVVVALVGIGLVLAAPDDERGTVADDGDEPVEAGSGATRFSLADPAALGYRVRAAFGPDTARGSMDPAPLDIEWTAHVPTGADADADASIVLAATLPPEAHDGSGEVVDIGGREALLRVLGLQAQLWWEEAGSARQLSSVHLPAEDLVATARAAIAERWDGTSALPGHDLLHRGPIWDFSPVLAYASGGPTGRSGIAYDHPDEERDLVIGWSLGPQPAARAAARRTMASETAEYEVRGRPARFNRIGPRSEGELSWLEADGTLVEVVFLGDPVRVVALLDEGLAPISAGEHERLVAEHPPEPDQMLLDLPDRHFDPISEAPSLAELRGDGPAARTRVAITSHDLSGLNLVVEVAIGDEGAGGGGYPLPDVRTPAFQLMWLGEPGAGFAIGGVIPPGTDARGVTITDRATGAALVPEQLAVGGIPGSDHQLFVVVVPGVALGAGVDITFPTRDGDRTWRF